MNFTKQTMSDKFQIGCRTYIDELDSDIYDCGKAATTEFRVQKGQVLKDVALLTKTPTPVIDLLSSDDEKPTIHDMSTVVENDAKSRSNNLRLEYHAYREKHHNLPQEQRKGRAMNMQEFIWKKCKSTGEYKYGSDDSRDMKLKKS